METATSGSNTFALGYGTRALTATRSELGSWFDRLFTMPSGNVLTLRSRLAFAHDNNGGTGINAAFQTLPGSNFVVTGAAPLADLALLTAGAELQLANRLSFGMKIDSELARHSKTYAVAGTARYTW